MNFIVKWLTISLSTIILLSGCCQKITIKKKTDYSSGNKLFTTSRFTKCYGISYLKDKTILMDCIDDDCKVAEY